MFIQMYGLPNYQEFDPTLFVALSYSIIFGAMFGDAGQGLVLLIGGYLLYHLKDQPGSSSFELRILLYNFRTPLWQCIWL